MNCPFCKSEVYVRRHTNEYDMDKTTHYSISCCGCNVLMTDTNKKNIIRVWKKGEKK